MLHGIDMTNINVTVSVVVVDAHRRTQGGALGARAPPPKGGEKIVVDALRQRDQHDAMN